MPNSNKRKGTAFESKVRDYLNSSGQAAHRMAQAGDDVGDVHLNGMWTIQCKDVAQQRYAEWVPEAERQADRAGLKYSAVVHKRRGLSAGEALVVMTLDQFAEITNELRVSGMLVREGRNGN